MILDFFYSSCLVTQAVICERVPILSENPQPGRSFSPPTGPPPVGNQGQADLCVPRASPASGPVTTVWTTQCVNMNFQMTAFLTHYVAVISNTTKGEREEKRKEGWKEEREKGRDGQRILSTSPTRTRAATTASDRHLASDSNSLKPSLVSAHSKGHRGERRGLMPLEGRARLSPQALTVS